MDKLKKLVHIDFKGAPVKLEYLKSITLLIKQYGCDGLLLEYEDMFPYGGTISELARPDAYTKTELEDFLSFCEKENLIVIPLVQTFGHLEFVLKHEKMRCLRENYRYPMTICPSLKESDVLLKEMIDQILLLHSKATWLHIGADEVFDINLCQNCHLKELDKSHMFLQHILNIARYVKKIKNVQPIIWDDMLRDIDVELIKASELTNFVEVMMWDYAPTLNLSDNYINRMVSIFPKVWAASAFKGANGAIQQVVNTSVYVKNNQSWVAKIKATNEQQHNKFFGIVLTGWSRFDHFGSLCELLPCGIPCLSLCLQIITGQGQFTEDVHATVSQQLGFPELIPWDPFVKCVDPSCLLAFPGYQVFQAMSGWYLLCCEMTMLMNSDYVIGWMSRYHRDKMQGNVARVEHIVKQMESLLNRFGDWSKIFEPEIRQVLSMAAADEWFQCYVNHRVSKLIKRIRQGRQLIAIGDSVFDRSAEQMEAAVGDCL